MDPNEMTYEELVSMIGGLHSQDKVKEAYKRILRHLFLTREDLVSDLVLIYQTHERTNRDSFGLQAKVRNQNEEMKNLRFRLHQRENRRDH